ncbi:MAG: hypothetical protein M5U28_22480 [Sandaracinaceae bacterium]|nr:hypothetical protein [Sandaracinaceae bacterium]
MNRDPRRDALVRDLSVVDLDGPAFQRWLGPRIVELFGCEASLIHGMGFGDNGFDLGECVLTGGARDDALERDVRAHGERYSDIYSSYDPRSIDPRQANRALLMPSPRQLRERGLPPSLLRSRHVSEKLEIGLHRFREEMVPLYVRWGQLDSRHLRVLLCEGRRMIGYVGALQPSAFSRDAQRAMAALVPAMRRRFRDRGAAARRACGARAR